MEQRQAKPRIDASALNRMCGVCLLLAASALSFAQSLEQQVLGEWTMEPRILDFPGVVYYQEEASIFISERRFFLATFEDLRSQCHSLGLYCVECDRWGEANLDWLIESGRGNRPLTESRFKCRDCGAIVEKQLRPPVPKLGGAVAYI